MSTARIREIALPKLLGGGQYMLIGNLIESQFISVGDWNFGSAISLIPLSTPGMDNFQITFVKVWNLFAPRS